MSVFVNNGTEYNVNDPNVADEFESGDFNAGEYAFKNGSLWRFRKTHSGAWTGTDVGAARVGKEINDIRIARTDAQKAQMYQYRMENASVSGYGTVVEFSGETQRDLFVCYIGGASSVVISNGELYAMFFDRPEMGSTGSDRVMMNESGPVTVSIPDGYNYIAVRSQPDRVPMFVPHGNVQDELINVNTAAKRGDLVIGHIDHAGIYAAGDIATLEATNVYFAPVYGLEKVWVTKGDFVGFYQYYPVIGLQGISQRQAISDGEVVDIPANAFYIGVRTLSDSKVFAYGLRNSEWIVDKNGRGDFTTVAEAVAQASSGDTIRIRPGNYTNEVVEAFGKELYIIGEDKQSVIISNTLDQYDNPPLEMSVGLLENVTIEAVRNSQTAKGAYAMHNEDNFGYGKTFTVRNCIFKAASGAAVGMGMRGDYSVVFENCDFIATDYIEGFGSSGYALYFHDTVQQDYAGADKVAFRNCRLYATHGAGVAIRIDSAGLDGNTVEVQFIGNAVANPNNSGGSYLSLHNNGGPNSDWYGLKGFSNSRLSYRNQIDDIDYGTSN